MVRVLVAGLLLAAVLTYAPRGGEANVSPLIAGSRTSVTHHLPYRVSAPQVNWNLEVTVVNLVNGERRVAGVAPLMPHAGIRHAARAHGVEMFSLGYLSHRSQDGRWPDERVKSLGVRVKVVGENVAHASDVLEAHHALMASAPHRENILSTRYRLLGVGVIDGGPFGVIVVQDFSD